MLSCRCLYWFLTASLHACLLDGQLSMQRTCIPQRWHLCHLQAVLKLSEEQLADCDLLRRFYFTKRHSISSQQAALASQIQGVSLEAASTTIMQESTYVDQLQQNVAESHDVHKRTQWTLYCGVSFLSCIPVVQWQYCILPVQLSQAVMLLIKHTCKATHPACHGCALDMRTYNRHLYAQFLISRFWLIVDIV